MTDLNEFPETQELDEWTADLSEGLRRMIDSFGHDTDAPMVAKGRALAMGGIYALQLGTSRDFTADYLQEIVNGLRAPTSFN